MSPSLLKQNETFKKINNLRMIKSHEVSVSIFPRVLMDNKYNLFEQICKNNFYEIGKTIKQKLTSQTETTLQSD